MQYTAGRLVRLAKRERNSARPYLFVNPLQGKHIPVSPEETAAMCRAAADLVREAYPRDRLYVVGFAETATGIAASVCSFLENAAYYQNTTREPGGDALCFSEVHSHAVDQLLRTDGMEAALRDAGRMILIDDEVTTGNTICHLIRMIRERFGAEHLRFTILSLLNSMSAERFEEMRALGVDCLSLCRIPFEYGKDSILDVGFDPDLHPSFAGSAGAPAPALTFTAPGNPRGLLRFPDYAEAVRAFAEEIRARLFASGVCGSLLVLGTEEFMYPALAAGETLRREGCAKEVLVHATTRSPILASGRDGYPLFRRYQIRSPYDPGRMTYIYNLRRADRVLVLTDADAASPGMGDLCAALEAAGNREIAVARWKYDDKETV